MSSDMAEQSSAAKMWYLKKFDLFGHLDEEEMETLGNMAHVQDIPASKPLYFPGDVSDTVFMLKKGRVRLCRTTPDGDELTLAIIEPGEIFGELAVAGEAERTTRAETLEKSFLCAVSRDQFKEFLRDNPELNFRLTEMVGDRRRQIEQHVENLMFRDARSRLAFVLDDLFSNHASGEDDGDRPFIEFTHEQIADLVGLTRPTVTTVLNEFEDDGILEQDRKRLTLLDRPRLNRRAESS